ncbi:hypothetical protein MANES_11G111300v8 [Manihot esculenta]|uniref:Uncharacterized protein n=1 Tax=Manihot esculenta TaxID=3983 RepID=A0ACB7GXA7_MANES|nr:hypothetical protein MANES_11G111300v8 [Manihot esculenta]
MKNVHGNTALHEAVMHHRHDVVLFLISADPAVWYCQNTVGWSPLYMAVRVNDMQMLRLLLRAPIEDRDALTRLEGNSPAHAAVLVENIAYGGDGEAVRFISSQFRWSMFEMDNKGFLPIHIASKKGYVEIVKELFNKWPYPKELLNREGQSILHVAAKSGRNNVVKYILKTPILKKKLLNTTDINGNTPLHLAAMHSHPAVVLTLTWQNEIEINLLNNESLTPFDVSPKFFSKAPRGQYNLTNSALWSAGALPSFDAKIQKQKEKTSKSRKAPEIEWVKERVGMLLMKETLVATATFAATFTVPGGFNSSENPEKGIATMLNNRMFLLFVVCNTIAFYSSIISIFSMLWTTTSDYFVVCRAYSFSQNLFVFALGMMSLAFMAAIHVAVSKVSWLAYYTVILGIISLAILVLMFTAFEFPLGHSPRFMRCISYYISYAIIPLLGDYDELPIDKAEESEHNEQEKLRKDEQQESLSEEKMRN